MEECEFKLTIRVETSERSKYERIDVLKYLRTELVNAINEILNLHCYKGNIHTGYAIRTIE